MIHDPRGPGNSSALERLAYHRAGVRAALADLRIEREEIAAALRALDGAIVGAELELRSDVVGAMAARRARILGATETTGPRRRERDGPRHHDASALDERTARSIELYLPATPTRPRALPFQTLLPAEDP